MTGGQRSDIEGETAAPLHQKESAEVVWAPGGDTSWSPPFRGVHLGGDPERTVLLVWERLGIPQAELTVHWGLLLTVNRPPNNQQETDGWIDGRMDGWTGGWMDGF